MRHARTPLEDQVELEPSRPIADLQARIRAA
jgi:hypothetical protein